jgi:hypothetical protein
MEGGVSTLTCSLIEVLTCRDIVTRKIFQVMFLSGPIEILINIGV